MTFKAKARPAFGPQAQNLIDLYEKVYGAAGPGCNPASLAAVLRVVAAFEVDLHAIADELDPLPRQ